MKRLEINETDNDHLTENERLQLGDALHILARMITRAVLDEKSLMEKSQHKECGDSSLRPYQVTETESFDEPLTLSVQATARMLGLSRASVYEAIRTGQIPSIRFGKRIVVPRVALNKILIRADNDKSEYR